MWKGTGRNAIFADVPDAVRRRMSAIRGKDTKPEIALRSGLHAMGYRFRKNVRSLPGVPDIAIARRKKAVFVHGCFWHQHECQNGRVPRTRQEYWLPKLARVKQRDAVLTKLYNDIGWATLTVWECDLTARLDQTVERVATFLGPRSG